MVMVAVGEWERRWAYQSDKLGKEESHVEER